MKDGEECGFLGLGVEGRFEGLRLILAVIKRSVSVPLLVTCLLISSMSHNITFMTIHRNGWGFGGGC